MCIRDRFKGNGNSILNAYDVAMDEIFGVIDKHITAGHRIRLSGGDPCMFPSESLQIAKYCWNKHGQKISLAHNGSSPSLICTLLPYLDYVAIDFKGATPEEIARRSNTPVSYTHLDVYKRQVLMSYLLKLSLLIRFRFCLLF